jgi:hypothetical protein
MRGPQALPLTETVKTAETDVHDLVTCSGHLFSLHQLSLLSHHVFEARVSIPALIPIPIP